jgi:crotonobetainyl-CoA:carnitine CoA-transferase CaiB-like acyl-CoA transferase
LDGIRVIELGLFAVAPWASKQLAVLGAEVIKVEDPAGEPSHFVDPHISGTAALYVSANLNKRHVTLDLKDPAEHQRALDLIRTADVFMENMRPGTAGRLGLGYEELSALNPRLVYASASAYGNSGRMADEAGADPFVQAFCGWCSVTGSPGTDGEMLRYMAHLDITTASMMAEAVLMALLSRERTGRGQKIQISMLAAAMALQSTRLAEYHATGVQPPPRGSASSTHAPDQAFRCQDGKYVFVSVLSDGQWARFCELLRVKGLAEDPRFATNRARLANLESLQDLLRPVFGAKPLTWWLLQFRRGEIPAGRALSFEDVQNDRQVLANRYVQELDTPHWGRVLVEGLPWTFERTPARSYRSGGLKGEHTDEVLAALGTPETGVHDGRQP